MTKRELTFKGSHQEIGEQVGDLYKKWGKKELYVPHLIDDYYPKQLELYQKFFPNYINFLDGVAKGLEINKDIVLKSYLTGFLAVAHQASQKCSAFALKNDQGILVGRNYDWLESSEETSQMLHFEFTDNSSKNFTGISDMGTWEVGVKVGIEKFVLIVDEAWNSDGLYIAINGAPGKKREAGISTPHIVQLIAEQCSDTKSAVDLITQIPTPDSKIFTIADKNGNFAVVEKSLVGGTKVRESKDFIIATNHFNHPDLLKENIQIFKDVPFHSTFARYSYLQYNLQESVPNMDLNKINVLLGKKPTLQNWRGLDNGDVLTVWINSLNLVNGEYQVQFAPLKDPVWVKSDK